MTSTDGWELPEECYRCPDRKRDYCRRHNCTVWIAWRKVGGCDVTHRRGKESRAAAGK